AAVDNTDPAIVELQRICANLRDHRLEALAERCPSGNDFDDAVMVDRNLHAIARPEAALLDKYRKSGSHRLALCPPPAQARLQLIPTEGGEGLVEQRGIVARIVDDLVAKCIEGTLIRHLRARD